MTDTKFYFIGGMVALIISCFVIFLFTGCISYPDKKDYENRPKVCYDEAVCRYYSAKGKVIDPECTDKGKECRTYERYNFCRDDKNLPIGNSFQSCWDKLNSK